jgi:formylglycine-generating enzyme required for sulfatase activity
MEKIIRILMLSFLTIAVATSCSDDSHSGDNNSVAPEQDELNVDGFVYVQAKGKKTTLGTDDVSAKTLERPKMTAEFTYDFYIGRHEVICKDFNDLMRKETGVKLSCKQDSLPAANVTFYDVVL